MFGREEVFKEINTEPGLVKRYAVAILISYKLWKNGDNVKG